VIDAWGLCGKNIAPQEGVRFSESDSGQKRFGNIWPGAGGFRFEEDPIEEPVLRQQCLIGRRPCVVGVRKRQRSGRDARRKNQDCRKQQSVQRCEDNAESKHSVWPQNRDDTTALLALVPSVRRRADSNRRIKVLQTSPLPLGYGANASG
jgi:hypothetical protein